MPPRLPTLALLFCTSVARAAEIGAGSTGGATPDLGASALQMIFGLIVVLALLFGALWLLKRISQPQGAAAGLLRVVAGIAVGSRERVVILELGNTWLVLGVAPGRISALAEIPRQEAPASTATAMGPPGKDFPTWLKQMVDRRGQS